MPFRVCTLFLKLGSHYYREPPAPAGGGSTQKWSLCQAITYARRGKAHVAMTAADNFCVPASSYRQRWLPFVSYNDMIESQRINKWRETMKSEKKVQAEFVAEIVLYTGGITLNY
jgi:hypothetical protein